MTTRPRLYRGNKLMGLVAVGLFGLLTAVFLTSGFGTAEGFVDGSVTRSIGYAMFNLDSGAVAGEGFLVAFSFYWGNVTGQVFTLFTMALAAAEVAIGIGIILVLYRNFDDVNVTEATTLRW